METLDAHFDPVLVPLLSAIERTPGDYTPYLVAADRLQELDAEPHFEAALRWMAKRSLRPVKRDDIRRLPWRWYRHNASSLTGGGAMPAKLRPAGMPAFVFRCCCPTGEAARKEFAGFASWQKAAAWLAAGLRRIREDYL